MLWYTKQRKGVRTMSETMLDLLALKQVPAPKKTAVILELLKTMDNDEICELMVEISSYINAIS